MLFWFGNSKFKSQKTLKILENQNILSVHHHYLYSIIAIFLNVVSSDKRTRQLLNLEVLKCHVYRGRRWKKGGTYFKIGISYSDDILKVCYYLFSNKNK